MSLTLLYDARPLTDPNSGGVRRVAGMLLDAILASDLDATVTCITTGFKKPALPEPFASHPRITHVHVRIPNKIWSLLAMMGVVSLDRIAKGQGKRILGHILYSPTPDPCPPTHVALLPNLGFTGFIEIPYALVLHDLSFLIEPRWFPWKMRLWHIAVNPKELARRAQIIFCVSETTAHDAERLLKIPREKIRVFKPGIPRRVGSRESGVESPDSELTTHDGSLPRVHPRELTTAPYVLAFGERDARKNAATAIAAVETLRREDAFKNLKLILIGSRTGEAGPRPSVILLPRPSDAELADLYAHASALLYPSWYEGFGLPLHEAARFGTPCIASTWGALPETAPRGTVFAPPSKPHLWASALRDILAAPERYRTAFDEAAATTDAAPIIEWLKRLEKDSA